MSDKLSTAVTTALDDAKWRIIWQTALTPDQITFEAREETQYSSHWRTPSTQITKIILKGVTGFYVGNKDAVAVVKQPATSRLVAERLDAVRAWWAVNTSAEEFAAERARQAAEHQADDARAQAEIVAGIENLAATLADERSRALGYANFAPWSELEPQAQAVWRAVAKAALAWTVRQDRGYERPEGTASLGYLQEAVIKEKRYQTV